MLLRDIQLATINGLRRSAVPNCGRAYHGNATKRREQREVVEGTHVSVAVIMVLSLEGIHSSTRRERGIPERKKTAKRGRCNEWILCWGIVGQHGRPDHVYIDSFASLPE